MSLLNDVSYLNSLRPVLSILFLCTSFLCTKCLKARKIRAFWNVFCYIYGRWATVLQLCRGNTNSMKSIPEAL